jgi:hypothetical protein
MIPDLIADALREELEPRREQLAAILSEALLIQNWLPQAPSPQLRARLEGRQNELALSLLALLTTWNSRGGNVVLESPALPKPLAIVVPKAVTEPPAPEKPPPPVVRTEERAVPLPRVEPRRGEQEGESASSESVLRLAEHFRSGGLLRESPSTPWPGELAAVLAQMPLGADDEVELDRCYRAIRDCDRWRVFPKDLQRALIGLMASRLRRLQDERGVNTLRIEESFSRLSAFSKREQPGYVIGLSRHHRPMRGSWDEDSESYWDRLAACLPEEVAPEARPNLEKMLSELESLSAECSAAPSPEIAEAVAAQLRRTLREGLKSGLSSRDPRLVRVLAPHQELLDSPDFRSLRRAIRTAEEEEEHTGEGAEPELPEDWRWWARTRGRNVVIVGGDPREPNRLRIKEAFRMAELDWETAEFKRNSLQTVRDRVRAGKVDLVIILGAFVGHDADDVILPACRDRGVDWVHVDKGYGIVRIRHAIERFLDPSPPEHSDSY